MLIWGSLLMIMVTWDFNLFSYPFLIVSNTKYPKTEKRQFNMNSYSNLQDTMQNWSDFLLKKLSKLSRFTVPTHQIQIGDDRVNPMFYRTLVSNVAKNIILINRDACATPGKMTPCLVVAQSKPNELWSLSSSTHHRPPATRDTWSGTVLARFIWRKIE